MWVTKLLISPVKKRIFCPKTTKFSPKLAILSIAGSFGALLVGRLVVVARAVSRKTPIYFILKRIKGPGHHLDLPHQLPLQRISLNPVAIAWDACQTSNESKSNASPFLLLSPRKVQS